MQQVKVPSSDEEGRLRGKKNCEATLARADGRGAQAR